jgi:metal-responsive CopG/Arc/MetJ family transcriptional regulator
MEQQDFIPEAAMVASAIARKGVIGGKGVVKSVGLRMPVHLLIYIDAMAAHAGKSRTSMISALLEVGLEEVRKHLDDKTAAELEPMYVDAARDLMPAGEETESEEF